MNQLGFLSLMLAAVVLASNFETTEGVQPLGSQKKVVTESGARTTSASHGVDVIVTAVASATESEDAGSIQEAGGPMSCVTAFDCLTDPANNACNHASCSAGTCTFTCERFGDVQPPGGNGLAGNLDDILCVIGGFSNLQSCRNGDIHPCGADADIDIDDILAILASFAGANPCGCTENTAPGTGQPALCGSSMP